MEEGLLNRRLPPASLVMASEIFGTAALFWVLIPVGLLGGSLLLKALKD
jgi:cytochrome b6-f complex subunit 7